MIGWEQEAATVHEKGAKDKRVQCNFCSACWAYPRQVPCLAQHLLTECKDCPKHLKAAATDYLASRALITNMKEVEGEGGLESTSKSQPSVLMIARNASQEKKFMHVNNAIIDLICVSGVPPEFFSGQPWKNFMAVTDPMTHTSSASTFAHTFIPAEATHITEEVFQKLRKQINLSFDGGTTHAIQSIYHVHVITAEKHTAYLVEGD